MGKKWWIFGVFAIFAILCWNGKGRDSLSLPVFSQPQQTVAALATDSRQEVEFPFVLRSTGLIVENIARYEGPFLENILQQEVAEVAALMVYNPGTQWVRAAKVLVAQGDEEYVFEITYLPPNSRVLVLERDARRYLDAPITDCRCLSLSETEFTLCADQIRITETGSGLMVENLTKQQVSRVVLYYKQYVQESGFYLGGYTCQKEVADLAAGESREVDVYRYVPGYSRMVAVKWEE